MAMLVIDTEPFAHTTKTAVFAVKDGFLSIAEQATGSTVILRQLSSVALLRLTELANRLDCEAVHTQHLLCRIPINLVISGLVVTKPTSEELSTAFRTNFGLTWVVLAAQY